MGNPLTQDPAGTTVDQLHKTATMSLTAGKGLVKAGVSGQGTPFQQAALKSFTTQATANLKAYESQAGVNDVGAGGAADIVQSAKVMLNQFTEQDIGTGAGFLENSISADTAAEKIQLSQDQMMGQALMSAAEVFAMIFFA